MGQSELLGRGPSQKSASKSLDRRRFFASASAIGVGVAAATFLGGTLDRVFAATITDGDIINFALNLEYLEAEFYSVATFGATLRKRGIIGAGDETGPTTGGNMVPGLGDSSVAFLARQLRRDETEHVTYLRKALGTAAAKKPAINLDALGFGFEGVNEFLQVARIFEDVGVSAYLGAAPLITNKTYLDAAARILSTEAQHAGAIRLENVIRGVKTPAVDAKDNPPTSDKPFNVDGNGLSIPRSTSEVLKIVYGGNTQPGGFYPDGLNGTIK